MAEQPDRMKEIVEWGYVASFAAFLAAVNLGAIGLVWGEYFVFRLAASICVVSCTLTVVCKSLRDVIAEESK